MSDKPLDMVGVPVGGVGKHDFKLSLRTPESREAYLMDQTFKLMNEQAALKAEIDKLKDRLAYAFNEFQYIGSEECCVIDLAKRAAGDGVKACDLSREFVG